MIFENTSNKRSPNADRKSSASKPFTGTVKVDTSRRNSLQLWKWTFQVTQVFSSDCLRRKNLDGRSPKTDRTLNLSRRQRTSVHWDAFLNRKPNDFLFDIRRD
ncbi:hypothetical protein CSING_05010 [Corynebacterium singulare]|uniref:Uncharacterized protein n=1 Tax=Corynebacterium singulare TaxID=161899 RepID=A0A0B6F3E2_9CORY|nr:hypothetical protein CSING_05010 [Corynebacterium singulare]